MKNKVAILNATPLISLAILDQLALLSKIFYKVVIPSEVSKEVVQEGKFKSKEIGAWIKDKVVASQNKHWIELFSISLDKGESEVLALYHEINNSIVVIDESKARKLAAKQKIPHIGTLGVLLLAKRLGMLDAIAPLLEKLKENGIRISQELCAYILKEAGESLL